MDTIFAVSSGRPPAAIAVMRISGGEAANVARSLARSLPPPRRAVVRALRDAEGEPLDRVLCLWFPGPATATGEDMLELHLHGGRAVVAAVERALAALPGLRAAEPGEFTRRALVNGRIDLTQAQGLADLLEAETEQQRRAAIAASEGRLGDLLRDWLDRLSMIAAQIEAAIDFSDEDDIVASDDDALDRDIANLVSEMQAAVARPSVERVAQGIRVVLAGPPNAGKSSLFNALVDREAAIVSPIAGTTRDVIEVTVKRNGRLFTLVDTAGQRSSVDDPIEATGIGRAKAAMEVADIVLWLDDDGPAIDALWVYPRVDQSPRSNTPANSLGVSVQRAETIEALWSEVEGRAQSLLSIDPAIFHDCQQAAVCNAIAALSRDATSDDWLIRAEAVRHAHRAIASMLGLDATEAMLDALFARFCIGK